MYVGILKHIKTRRAVTEEIRTAHLIDVVDEKEAWEFMRKMGEALRLDADIDRDDYGWDVVRVVDSSSWD